jgi:ankyrin repeat protein
VSTGSSADINVCNYSGNTPLMTAAVHGQFEAVKFLVLKGADLNAANYEGWTPLEAAANYGHDATW